MDERSDQPPEPEDTDFPHGDTEDPAVAGRAVTDPAEVPPDEGDVGSTAPGEGE